MAETLSERIVRERLVSYAHWYVSKKGYRFGPGANADIDLMLQRGARKVHSETRGRSDEDAEATLRKAEASIRRLVNRMIREADRIPGYAARNRRTVGEQTLSFALKDLCPLWPIC